MSVRGERRMVIRYRHLQTPYHSRKHEENCSLKT